MGRLFWKFFLCIWTAQVLGTMAVMMMLRWEHRLAAGIPLGHHHGVQVGAKADILHAPAALLPPEPLVAHLLASLVVAAILARYLSRPIQRLRAAFRTAATGNLEVGVAGAPIRRRDELSDLLQEFESMAARLRALMDSQRRLLHDVSHEVRSPLARMQAAIGLARQQPDKAQALLDRIEREVRRIDRLVDDLLALSRLEVSGTGEPVEEVDIGTILADIADSAQFEAHANGKTFAMSGQAGVAVAGNAQLLHRAIENVVRNALQHTGPGSHVRLDAGIRADGSLRIAVSDNGAGVPPDRLEAIFEPFYRGVGPGHHTGGHGLGLAIAKRIVQAHGASIHAFNLPRAGLCVEILIPQARLVVND